MAYINYFTIIHNDRSNIEHLKILKKKVANLCYQFVLVIYKLEILFAIPRHYY